MPSRSPNLTVLAALELWGRPGGPPPLEELLARYPGIVETRGLESLKGELDERIWRHPRSAAQVADLIDRIAAHTRSPAHRALALRSLGQVEHVSGRYADAARLYRDAIGIYDDLDRPREAARVRKTRLDPLMYLGRYDEGEAEARRARAQLDPVTDRSLLGEIDINLGNLLLRRGRSREARASYERAVAHLDATDEPVLHATATLNLANTLVESLEIEEAERLYAEAARGFAASGRPALVAEAQYGALYLDVSRGRFGRVLQRASGVREAYESCGHQRGMGLVEMSTAAARLALGFPGAAFEAAKRAWACFADDGPAIERGRALMIQSRALARLGRVNEAAELIGRAGVLFLIDGHVGLECSARLCQAELALERGDVAAARSVADSALVEVDALGLVREGAFGRLIIARALLGSRQDEEALALLAEVQARSREFPDPWLRLDLLSLRAAVLLATDQREEAEAALEEASLQLHLITDAVASSELRMGILGNHGELLRDLAGLVVDRGAVERGFELSRRAKALADPREPHAAPAEGARAVQDELRSRLAVLYRRQAEIGSDQTVDEPDWRGDLATRIRGSELELLQSVRELTLHEDRSPHPSTGPLPSGRLPAHATMVDFLVVRDRLLAFLVPHDASPRAVDVGRPARVLRLLDYLRLEWTQGLRRAALRDSIVELLDELGALLMAPVLANLPPDTRRLVIVPDRGLALSPFHALRVDERPLFHDYEVIVATSVSSYCRRAGSTPAPLRVIAAGMSDAAAPAIAEELEAIRGIWRDRCELVSARRLGEHLGQRDRCSILHLAAHGVARPDFPALGGVNLEDGVFSGFEIGAAPFPADLVVLSGCETGLTDPRSTERLAGLSAACVSAGARGVLASLFPVDDASACRFMVSFHEHRARDATAVDSHRRACLALDEADGSGASLPWVLAGSAELL